MKRIAFSLVAVAVVAGVAAGLAFASGHSQGAAAPIYGVTIPDGIRDWKLIAVDQLIVPGGGDQLRTQLGNKPAIKAFKEGKLPFPVSNLIWIE